MRASNFDLLLSLKKVTECWKKYELSKIPGKFKVQAQFILCKESEMMTTTLSCYSDNLENIKNCLTELSEIGDCKNFFMKAKIEDLQEFEFEIGKIKIVYSKI